MGLCNPCPTNIERETNSIRKREQMSQYLNNVRAIKRILNGNIKTLKKDTFKKMLDYSKLKFYEKAEIERQILVKLDYLTTETHSAGSYIENPNLTDDIQESEIKELKHLLVVNGIVIKKIKRIECYDVAHLAGKFPTASMVVSINAAMVPSLYRHFNVPKKFGGDDYLSLKNVTARRIKHFADWEKPDLVIVDGGKGQVNAIADEFSTHGVVVVGIAKQQETLVIPIKGSTFKFSEIKITGSVNNLITRLRNEAHRFARKLHHKNVKKELLLSAKI